MDGIECFSRGFFRRYGRAKRMMSSGDNVFLKEDVRVTQTNDPMGNGAVILATSCLNHFAIRGPILGNGVASCPRRRGERYIAPSLVNAICAWIDEIAPWRA
ncbi:MAG: hypothetical protein ACT6U0_20345 [Shinella sp.]|uniref:hypothetical protein n=1 Tax=Shinella sp. TaxID=1870904 RepID=UPI004035B11A